MSESANPEGKVHEVRGAKGIALGLLGHFVRSWQETLIYEIPELASRAFASNPNGFLILLWHNRLFPGIGALRNTDIEGHKLHALVSASRDGAQLSQFLRAQGIYPIRGSSSRRGSTAARELVKTMHEGNAVAITVDGPRGPCYEAQKGAALLMQSTGVPTYLIGLECESCWELPSWDRFILPKPFSRVRLKVDRIAPVDPDGGKEGRKAIQRVIQERLSALTEDSHRRL
jgi:lysophospholipid acyltransferase (LPLAT)-like uncharacterized protein